MAWTSLGTQFCLQLGFGVLLALAFVPRAPVGTFFYRIMGTTALVPILAGALVPVLVGQREWGDPLVLTSVAAIVTFPMYSGPVRGKAWAGALGVALAGCATAVVLAVSETGLARVGSGGRTLAALSALATGAVAGSVGLAMVLGHWYLTIPNLAIGHLKRLNRVTVGCLLASLALLVASCFAFRVPLNEADTPLFEPTGLFYLGTRVLVGLVMPLAFAGMTASSLRFGNTRSATGILYASTVLVLIGTAVSVSLQDSYGVPL